MAKVKVNVSTTVLGKRGEMALEADYLEDALKKIVEQSSGKTKARILDEDGKLSKFIDVFVNGRNINLLDGLATKLQDNDNIVILRVVSGG